MFAPSSRPEKKQRLLDVTHGNDNENEHFWLEHCPVFVIECISQFATIYTSKAFDYSARLDGHPDHDERYDEWFYCSACDKTFRFGNHITKLVLRWSKVKTTQEVVTQLAGECDDCKWKRVSHQFVGNGMATIIQSPVAGARAFASRGPDVPFALCCECASYLFDLFEHLTSSEFSTLRNEVLEPIRDILTHHTKFSADIINLLLEWLCPRISTDD